MEAVNTKYNLVDAAKSAVEKTAEKAAFERVTAEKHDGVKAAIEKALAERSEAEKTTA